MNKAHILIRRVGFHIAAHFITHALNVIYRKDGRRRPLTLNGRGGYIYHVSRIPVASIMQHAYDAQTDNTNTQSRQHYGPDWTSAVHSDDDNIVTLAED